MDKDLVDLKRITREIVNPGKQLIDLIPEAQALRDLSEQRTGFCVNGDFRRPMIDLFEGANAVST